MVIAQHVPEHRRVLLISADGLVVQRPPGDRRDVALQAPPDDGGSKVDGVKEPSLGPVAACQNDAVGFDG